MYSAVLQEVSDTKALCPPRRFSQLKMTAALLKTSAEISVYYTDILSMFTST